MKLFTSSNVHDGRIILDTSELITCELAWQKAGLTYTASGYGAKIPSRYKINYNGKLYRLYHTCYGNASSVWFVVKGQKIHVA